MYTCCINLILLLKKFDNVNRIGIQVQGGLKKVQLSEIKHFFGAFELIISALTDYSETNYSIWKQLGSE